MQAAANAVQKVGNSSDARATSCLLTLTDFEQQMGEVPTVVHAETKPRPDGGTMKALAWYGAQDVRLVDAPIPDITEPDDVILKVTGTTICGSDLHLYHGEIMTLQKGDILGHEVRLYSTSDLTS